VDTVHGCVSTKHVVCVETADGTAKEGWREVVAAVMMARGMGACIGLQGG
jgi:hypothetical protein